METKKLLARTIVGEFHGEAEAMAAEERFERTVQRKETPDEMPELAAQPGETLLALLLRAKLAPSAREARRLFEQGAVSVDGQKADSDAVVSAGTVVQVGKRRWLRLI